MVPVRRPVHVHVQRGLLELHALTEPRQVKQINLLLVLAANKIVDSYYSIANRPFFLIIFVFLMKTKCTLLQGANKATT